MSDVEAALVDALGEQASVSRSTVSRICAQIKTEFEAWSRKIVVGASFRSDVPHGPTFSARPKRRTPPSTSRADAAGAVGEGRS